MSVCLGRLLSIDKLNLTRHRWIGVTTRSRINVAQQGSVVGIAIARAHCFERFVNIFECISKWYAAPIDLVLLGRSRKTHPGERFAGLLGNVLLRLFRILEEQNV